MRSCVLYIAAILASGVSAMKYGVVLIGGGENGTDATNIFAHVARLGGGSAARFCVIGAAAGTDAPNQVAHYCDLLLHSEVASCNGVPIDATGPGRANASNPAVVALIASCSGFFLVGGDQMLILQSLFDDGHLRTPALDALHAALSQSGGVIAGTSAGAESQTLGAVVGGGTSQYALVYGASEWMPGDPQNDEPGNLTAAMSGGLATYSPALIDAHLAQRGRQGRQLRLLLDTWRLAPTGMPYSIGIDENTALVVEPNGTAAVVGAGGVLLFDVVGSTEARISTVAAINQSRGSGTWWWCANVSATRLTEGDIVLLPDNATWSVTPAPHKVPLEGREHRGAAATSSDIFAEAGAPNGDAQWELVASSLVDARNSDMSWGVALAPALPSVNVSFLKVAGKTRGFDGTHPISGRYAISYTDLRVDVVVSPASMTPTVTAHVDDASHLSQTSHDLPRDSAVSVNIVDLLWSYAGLTTGNASFARDTMFAACQQRNFTFIRFAALPYWPRDISALYFADPSGYWKLMDAIVADATTASCRLMPSLFWNMLAIADVYHEPGGVVYDPALGPSEARSAMAEFAAAFATRYNSSATIIAWETGNEYNLIYDLNMTEQQPFICTACGSPAARTQADNVSTAGGVAWQQYMTKVLREADPMGRPVSSGHAMARPDATWRRENYAAAIPVPRFVDSVAQFYETTAMQQVGVQLMSQHIYAGSDNERFGINDPSSPAVLNYARAAAGAANQTLFVGEFGDATPGNRTFTKNVLALFESEVWRSPDGTPYFGCVWAWMLLQQWDTFSVNPGRDDEIITALMSHNARLLPRDRRS